MHPKNAPRTSFSAFRMAMYQPRRRWRLQMAPALLLSSARCEWDACRSVSVIPKVLETVTAALLYYYQGVIIGGDCEHQLSYERCAIKACRQASARNTRPGNKKSLLLIHRVGGSWRIVRAAPDLWSPGSGENRASPIRPTAATTTANRGVRTQRALRWQHLHSAQEGGERSLAHSSTLWRHLPSSFVAWARMAKVR